MGIFSKWFPRMAKRGYAAAAKGRNTGHYFGWNKSADAEISESGSTIRMRARQLDRDNGYARKAVGDLVTAIVGTGVEAQAAGKIGKRAAKQIADAWRAFEAGCDFDARGPLGSLIWTAVRAMIVDGEAFILRMRTEKGVKIRVVEADHLDSIRQGAVKNGGFILEGIEYDKDQRRVAYWLFPRHPGGLAPFASQNPIGGSVRIPAEDVIHLFERLRPGQNRGVSWLCAAIIDLGHLSEYQEAELIRKKIEACFSVFVTQPEGSPLKDNVSSQEVTTASDADGVLIEQIMPGMINYLPPGSEINFSQPTANPGAADHEKSVLRKIAVGLSIPYEAISGDLSDVNYSSYRGARLSFKARIETVQWLTVIPVAYEVIWSWFIADAIVQGVISGALAGVKSSWTPPRFETTDPLKDTQAIVLQLAAGLVDWDSAVSSLGYDPISQAEKIAEIFARIDEMGLVFSWDPRKNPTAGQVAGDPSQPAAPAKARSSTASDIAA